MKILVLTILYSFSYSQFLIAQSHPDKNYHPPIGIPLVLAANFGELRPNHFHMGVDFKTNGKTGYRLYSIDEGYVSRIKVSPYGYGKVVYIDHPDGITSVYAHCSEFKGAIDSLVKLTQFNDQNYEVEIFPIPGSIKIGKGEVIALSGNTGSSTAPHLHFELRDTKTENALNPLLYGFDVDDSRAPELRDLKVYALTKEGYRYPGKTLTVPIIKGKSGYYISNSSVTIPSHFCSHTGGIGIAVNAIDRLNAAENQCGLYGSTLEVNGDTIFGQQLDRVPFESTRFVNTHKDFEEYDLYSKKFHKSYKTNENVLPIYTNVENNGIIQAKPGETYNIVYTGFDTKLNESKLTFNLVVSPGKINSSDKIWIDSSYLLPSESKSIKGKLNHIIFSPSTTYEPISINYNQIDTRILNFNIPTHNPYTILIPLVDKPDGKHYVEIRTESNRTKTLAVSYRNDSIVCISKYFGRYSLRRDTIGPSISPINFSPSSLSNNLKALRWKIVDAQTEIADYDLFVDGNWQLIEYEPKGNYVEFILPQFPKGKKELILKVVDKCGNETIWKEVLFFQ